MLKRELMQNITQTLFFKAILPWEVTNLHEKNMWPHQGCQQGLGTEMLVTALLMIILREIHVFNYNSLIGSHVETSKRSKKKN